jgi:hypothetical protein
VTRTPAPRPPSARTSKPISSPFEIAPALAVSEDSGSLRVGSFERLYETLFAEALEAGEISTGERQRLDLAASALGFDASRVANLEAALVAAWKAETALSQAGSAMPVDPATLADRAPPTSSPRPRGRISEDEPPTLARRGAKRRSPLPRTKASSALTARELEARFDAAVRARAIDDQWRIADVLVSRGIAAPKHLEVWESRRQPGPVRASRGLTANAWCTLLMHPEEDRTVSELFGVIASASLLGRVSAMRRDGTLPTLDPDAYHNPLTSPVAAVRGLAWAAATLGIRMPPTYVVPELDAGFEILTVVPPSTRVGARALGGVDAAQLAFACGRHLTWYKEEHFICTLVPSVAYLETIFCAALLLGTTSVGLADDVRARATVFAQAIRPCLELPQIDRLGQLVARILARGAIPSLKRWARAAEWTACRTGLLLCGHLSTAAAALANEPGGEARLAQLEAFWAGPEARDLRIELGVALR